MSEKKPCSIRNLKPIEERFRKKYNLDEDTARVYQDENCKIRKEVWMYGLGWVSEARFKRYLQLGQ